MKEFIEKLIGRLEEISAENTCSDCPYKSRCDEVQEQVKDETTDLCGATIKSLAISIVNQLAEECINTSTNTSSGWIPCSRKLPPQPKENALFEYKPLEVYLVSLSSTDYPWRAFWNGKYFTDGFSKVEPIAWMPLPAPYKEGCE